MGSRTQVPWTGREGRVPATEPPGKSLEFFLYVMPRGMQCSISVPQPGIKSMPPAVEAWSPNHWTAREVPTSWNLKVLKLYFPSIKGFLHTSKSFENRKLLTNKVKVKLLSRIWLCDPVDYSPPGFSVHGILQARILEWVASSFSRGSSWPRDWTQVSLIAGRHFNLWATREAPINQ